MLNLYNNGQESKVTERVRVVITYPDTNLPAINLWVLMPAWYYYATPEEREEYYMGLLNE